MDDTDKKQLAEFIAMQTAYKRARRMKASIKANPLTASQIVAIATKVKKPHAAGKKFTAIPNTSEISESTSSV